jgi:hypothetical protein
MVCFGGSQILVVASTDSRLHLMSLAVFAKKIVSAGEEVFYLVVLTLFENLSATLRADF